ncbi:MAG TPA: TIM barrel protein [Planctomycetota bacterium]|nr:TIM barrel protein [Planctomycetota bacterium]
MRFRIACHLCGWPKEVASNRRRVMEIVRDAGYEGVEGFGAKTADDLVEAAALAAEYGLHLVNFGGPDPATKARFNATLGNDAAEVPAQRKDGHEPSGEELAAKLDALKPPIADFAALGLKPFHHIHVGTILETTEDCARVLAGLPELWLLFDTGHLLAANSDPMDVLARWPKQIGHVHLKNFWTQDPAAGWDRHKPDFWKTSRFCDLAEGNTGLDVGAVLAGLAEAGYGGWISIEEDHPRRDIAAVARDNREFLRTLGY